MRPLNQQLRVEGRFGHQQQGVDVRHDFRSGQPVLPEASVAVAGIGVPKTVGVGAAEFGLRRFAESVAAYQQAEQLLESWNVPPDPEPAFGRGLAYLELGKNKEALAAFKDAERIRKDGKLPLDPQLDWYRAVIYHRQGDIERAYSLLLRSRKEYESQKQPVPPDLEKYIQEMADYLNESTPPQPRF